MGRFKFSNLSQAARRLRKELTSCVRGEPTDCDAQENDPERPSAYPSPCVSFTLLPAPLPSTSSSSVVSSTGVAEEEQDGELLPTVDESTVTDEAELMRTCSPKNVEMPSLSDDALTTTSEMEERGPRPTDKVVVESCPEEAKMPPIADENEKTQCQMEAAKTLEDIQEPAMADNDMESSALMQERVTSEPEVEECSSLETHPETVETQMKSDAEKQMDETSTATSVDPAEEVEQEIMLEGEHENVVDLPPSVTDSGSVSESSDQCLNESCAEEVLTSQQSASGQDVVTQDMKDGQCAEDNQTGSLIVRSTSSSDLLDKMLDQREKKELSSHQALTSVSQRSIVRGQRSDSSAFEIKLVRGFLGLGLTLGSDDLKEVVVQKIGFFSPAATQEGLRVGDRILKINDHSVIGKSPSQAQRLLGEVRWGEEVHILAMPPQETVIFRWVEEMNAGIIIMKLNTAFDKPLGIEVEGGSDTESPYIRIKHIKPGSVADECGLLKTGDELVQIDDYPMVGMTHFEAVDVIGHIYKPIMITVQRREHLDVPDRLASPHSSQRAVQ